MPAVRTFNITCPECNTILVVNRDTGAILEVRAPLVENPSGDRFTDAMEAHKQHSEKLKGLFSHSISDVSKQEQERRSVFEESLKKAREEGVDDEDRPLRDIDLD
jgi:hypothetical protein